MKGNAYQVQCVKNNIISKESRGEDASYERSLLKSWGHYKGWECATDALVSLTRSKSRASKQKVKGNLPVEEK